MARNFTRNELVLEKNACAEDSWSYDGNDDQDLKEILQNLKNLRVRPSLSITQKIIAYASMHTPAQA